MSYIYVHGHILILTGLSWIPSCDHVIISNSSSIVPYPPDVQRPVIAISNEIHVTAIMCWRKRRCRLCTRKSYEGISLPCHLSFPLVHVGDNLNFSNASTRYLVWEEEEIVGSRVDIALLRSWICFHRSEFQIVVKKSRMSHAKAQVYGLAPVAIMFSHRLQYHYI